jgi:hypothetical protein
MTTCSSQPYQHYSICTSLSALQYYHFSRSGSTTAAHAFRTTDPIRDLRIRSFQVWKNSKGQTGVACDKGNTRRPVFGLVVSPISHLLFLPVAVFLNQAEEIPNLFHPIPR